MLRTCRVAWKPICDFCIATIVSSRLTVGLSSCTSRCMRAASACDWLTDVKAWLSACWKPGASAACGLRSGWPAGVRPARATAWAKSNGFRVTLFIIAADLCGQPALRKNRTGWDAIVVSRLPDVVAN